MLGLGDRMKVYESIETDRKLIPLLPIYVRLDGVAFSNFTQGMDKPCDERMVTAMVETTKCLVGQTNACIGYTQSDEINLVIKSERLNSGDSFGNKIFKLTSILAGLTSATFLYEYLKAFKPDLNHFGVIPFFDCRVINMPSKTETANMILWREQDATKNAITTAARTIFSDKAIKNKSGAEKQEMLFDYGLNFNEYPEYFKRGVFVKKIKVHKEIDPETWDKIPEKHKPESREVEKSQVVSVPMPIFSKVTNREDVIFEGASPIVNEG